MRMNLQNMDGRWNRLGVCSAGLIWPKREAGECVRLEGQTAAAPVRESENR